jgi:hypothetical protein
MLDATVAFLEFLTDDAAARREPLWMPVRRRAAKARPGVAGAYSSMTVSVTRSGSRRAMALICPRGSSW